MKQFLKQYKYTTIALIIFVIVTVVSGINTYINSDPKIEATKQIQNLSEQQNTTTSLNQQIATSQTNTEYRVLNNASTTRTIINIPSAQNAEIKQPEQKQKITNSNNTTYYKILASDYTQALSSTSTVVDLMMYASADSRQPFLFRAKEYSGMGLFVEEINGLKNNNQTGEYWIYYLNGQSGKVGISQQLIKSNDIIEWKYIRQSDIF